MVAEAQQQRIVMPYTGGRAFDALCPDGTALPTVEQGAQLVLRSATRRDSTAGAAPDPAVLARVADALRPHLRLPAADAVAHTLMRAPLGDQRPAGGALVGALTAEMRFGAGGQLDSLVVTDAGAWRGLADSLRTALDAARRDGGLRTAVAEPASMHRIEIVPVRWPPAGAAVLGYRTFTFVVIDSAPRLLRPVRPTFPKALLQSGTNGTVQLRFVVDAYGVADRESFEDMMPVAAEFSAEARTAMRRAAFQPAMAGACRVPYLVTQSLVFRIAE